MLTENAIQELLAENPNVNEWTEKTVQDWLYASDLTNQQDGVAAAFSRNHVDGKRLLLLTEDELKTRSFNIQRLGRRKNIIRALNLLKANICRNINNGASVLHSASELDFHVNRSAVSVRPSEMMLKSRIPCFGSIDRSVILTNA